MFKNIINVSSRDTDGLGHVNNTSIPLWFESSRNNLYKIFNPEMKLVPDKWNLIMVHTEFDYIGQIFYGQDVEVRTYVEKIGNTSVTVYQEAWQNNLLKASGKAVLVYYNFSLEKKEVIPEEIRIKLQKHLKNTTS